jgi:hypothetical protein
VLHKLACQYAKFEDTFSIEHLVDLRSVCPDELKNITIIEVCKLQVRGSFIGCPHPQYGLIR